MLPPTFISDVRSMIGCLDDVNYVCDKCAKKVSSIMIQHIEKKIFQKMEKLNSGRRRDICELKTVLEEQRKLVHEGHVSIVDIKVQLGLLIGDEDNLKHTSNELLKEKIHYCNEMARTLKLVAPCEILFYLF